MEAGEELFLPRPAPGYGAPSQLQSYHQCADAHKTPVIL